MIKPALAEKLGTGRATLNRVLDKGNASITLNTLSRTAAALGCRVNLEIVATRGGGGRRAALELSPDINT